MTTRIRAATREDVAELVPLMRAEDCAEVRATGMEPAAALEQSLGLSLEAYAVEFDDELAGLFGVAPGPGTVLGGEEYAVAWLLTGGAVSRHPVAFARASRMVVGGLLERHPLLVNFIDARYLRALCWARWLGADVREAILFGSGLPFHPVIFRRATWAAR